MTEPLADTWHNRDLPVLRAVARGLEADSVGSGVRIHEIAETLGVTAEEVHTAARALESGGLVEMRWLTSASTHARFVDMSAEARRLVGLWPTPETALDRMIAALETIAENSDDEDTRTRARKALDAFTGGAKTIGLGVATAAITGQLPTT